MAFLALGIGAFWQILPGWFLSDDFYLIGRAAREGLYWTWGRGVGTFFRPVTALTYVASYALWGFAPLGYHLSNVILHGTNAFLVTLLCLALFRLRPVFSGDARPVAVLAGIIFLLLPSHSESVSWISGRTDLLAAFFTLLALLAFCHYLALGIGSRQAEAGGQPPPASQRTFEPRTRFLRRFAWLALTVIALALGMLSKESVLTAPFMVLILGLWAGARSGAWKRTAVGPALSFLAATAVLAVYLYFRSRATGVTLQPLSSGASVTYLAEGVWYGFRDVARIFLPALPPGSLRLLQSNVAWVACAVFVGALGALVSLRRRRLQGRWVALWIALLACLACAVLPVFGFKMPFYTTEGERFLYLPSVFGAIILASMLRWLLSSRRLFVAAGALLVVLYALTLQYVNSRWATAAALSKGLAAGVRLSAAADRVIVLNVPDNYLGAYIYRIGFGDALVTFRDQSKPPVYVVSFCDLRSPNDQISLRTADRKTFTVQLASPDAAFRTIADGPGIQAKLDGPQSLEVKLSSLRPTTEVLWFTGSEFVPVPPDLFRRPAVLSTTNVKVQYRHHIYMPLISQVAQ